MQKIVIEGGGRLCGTVQVGCAKNAVLPILAGCVLCGGRVEIENCPRFLDVANFVGALQDLGAKCVFANGSLVVETNNLCSTTINAQFAKKTRASVLLMGALSGRARFARLPQTGGCNIGARPIDLHILGLQTLGAKFFEDDGFLVCDAKNLHAGSVHLPFASVGATENIMLASVLLAGKTTIFGAAKEPEIVDLANFLNLAGAKIVGAGTSVIHIEGVKRLDGVKFCPIPDRIIAGTYLLAAVVAGGEVFLQNARAKHLESLLKPLKARAQVRTTKSGIWISAPKRICAIPHIATAPYPAFATDLQPLLASVLCTADGTSQIEENLFENRFDFARELCKMGAKIDVCGRVATIYGVKELVGAQVVAKDLRGGAGLVLAGLAARGQTVVEGAEHINRGYDNIVQDLGQLGARIAQD